MFFSYLCTMVGHVHIMGIVNLTEDSFYAGSRVSVANVAARVRQMLSDGADTIDFGACSTRPGSAQPTLEEEWSRLEPALCEIAGGGQVPGVQSPLISIDTYRAEIVRRAYEVIGPFLVNDISAGAMDPEMLTAVGRLGLPYVAMHMRGTPETMQQFTDYGDIVADVKAYFREFSLRAQNYELLRRMAELEELHRPILVGVSRKSMIYKLLGITPEEALSATQVVHFAALERGATWLRVHDVPEAVQTARLFNQTINNR